MYVVLHSVLHPCWNRNSHRSNHTSELENHFDPSRSAPSAYSRRRSLRALAGLGVVIAFGPTAGCGGNDTGAGIPSLTGHKIVTGGSSTVASGATSSTTASCPP